MQFKTLLPGSFEIIPDRIEDQRGFFARSYCKSEFAQQGISCEFDQCSISFNKAKGTLRGMHFQADPYGEYKLVRCTRGSIYDVIVDLRKESATFLQWTSVILSEENRKMVFVPPGFAHGFQTLEDASEVYYQIAGIYVPNAACGVRWNDPALKISWPDNVSMISDKDMTYEFLQL